MEINVIRCILILLVILIHLTPFKKCYPDVQNAVLAFVVPLFLFITGYLFNVNKTWKQYAVYLRSLLIMYVIFESAYIMLSYLFPIKDGINELSVYMILDKLLLNPIGPYWYLHTMIVCGSIYYATHQACRYINIDCAISISILVSITLSYWSPLLGLMAPLAYFAGVIFRKYFYCHTFCGSFVAILIAMVTLFYGIVYNPKYAMQLSYFSILLSACIIEFMIWCAKRLPSKVSKVLNYIGANTLPIYLFHPMFTLSSKLFFGSLITSGKIVCFSFLTIIIASIGSLMIGHTLDESGVSMLLFRKKIMR
ncbi:MAG: acyltransferase family protein [Prevotellaceae bacterium]|nr:acyltransferase family protein [Prevotellaceae bacterium]